ncbi:tail fiber assembly protein [Burkholderia mayonis]|uniref:Tail fiber assembly protein n=1 Tax=Burkholderia mayonis TaxID=1385591 RepID=A0A1B4G3W8_9BURK|nr:tail fiber assembly protein [Burkholderia mayonis]AOJ10610.1 hypothetical protein WS71_25880 [Burkholderia mayonis]
MKIYHFHSCTGALVGVGSADPDPMNAERWLIPAFSTTQEPPVQQEREWPFWRDDQWVMKPDYRGVTLFRTSDGIRAAIDEPGISAEEAGLTEVARPGDDYVWRDSKWQVDESLVAVRRKQTKTREFEERLSRVQSRLLGMGDALAAGLLDEAETAIFRAWATYQQELIRVFRSLSFPEIVWPNEPDEATVAHDVMGPPKDGNGP